MRLRRKLGEEGENPRHIFLNPRVAYRMGYGRCRFLHKDDSCLHESSRLIMERLPVDPSYPRATRKAACAGSSKNHFRVKVKAREWLVKIPIVKSTCVG